MNLRKLEGYREVEGDAELAAKILPGVAKLVYLLRLSTNFSLLHQN